LAWIAAVLHGASIRSAAQALVAEPVSSGPARLWLLASLSRRPDHHPRHQDHLEVRTLDALQHIDVRIVPARVWRKGDRRDESNDGDTGSMNQAFLDSSGTSST
jgi:hypothetical protein